MFEIPQFDPARDMRAPAFAEVLRHLQPRTQIADKWERLRTPPSKWWEHQRDHMEAWFSQAEGPGAYGRRRAQTAGQTYNRLLCPPAVLWIGEALGEDREIIREAANTAWGKKHIAAQCGVIRHYVPWERVFDLAQKKKMIR